jgi:RHS repeat-associated protein
MLDANHIVLCRYHYDPLDRMAGSSPAGADTVQRFYQKRRLATEIQGLVRRVVFQSEEQLLAQHESGSGQASSVLLTTDQQRSVLHQVDATQQTMRVYTAYGFDAARVNVPGFNGEHPDPLTGHHLLGNGYRAFNPVLMRFNSPDSLSPFGKGGLNAYAYCVGDPVNRVDPTGHMGVAQLVKLFKMARPLKALSKTRHPSMLSSKLIEPAELTTPAKLIAGNIDSVVKHRVSQVKKDFRVSNSRPLSKLEKSKREAFMDALQEANTLDPNERLVMSIQLRPLPEIPDGRVFRSSRFRKANDLPAYDLIRPHLPRVEPGGISGVLPRHRVLSSISEEQTSIREP